MKRGEIWTIAGGPDYAGKPRPAVIIQDDAFDVTRSVTVCPFTSAAGHFELARPLIEPSTTNGLRVPSRLMVDKITTVSRTRVEQKIGRLSPADVTRLNRAVFVFLGLGSVR